MSAVLDFLGRVLLDGSVYLLSGWRANVLGAGVLALVVVGISSFFTPYDVFDAEEATISPVGACPREGLRLTLERSWQRPNAWIGIRSVSVDSQWVNVDTGQIYPSVEETVVPTLEPTDGPIVSDLTRGAPDAPGTYLNEIDYTVNGRTGIVPAYDVEPTLYSNEVEVRAC